MEQMEQLEQKKDKNKEAQVKLIVSRVVAYVFLVFLTILCLFFFYILLVNASRTKAEIQSGFTPFFKGNFGENFKNTIASDNRWDFAKGLLNSTILALSSSILTTYFSALTAYAIHAYRFKMKRFAEVFILAIMMIPAQVSSVGFIKVCYNLGLTNNLFMLIIPAIAAPSTFFYMIQYLRATLPLELVEASRIDGTSEFGTFNRIVLPIMKPAIAVQFIFSFVGSWNNYYIPSLLLTDKDKKTLPVMIAALRNSDPSRLDLGMVYMAILFAILPVIIVYLILSKFIIKGVTSGSVKG